MVSLILFPKPSFSTWVISSNRWMLCLQALNDFCGLPSFTKIKSRLRFAVSSATVKPYSLYAPGIFLHSKEGIATDIIRPLRNDDRRALDLPVRKSFHLIIWIILGDRLKWLFNRRVFKPKRLKFAWIHIVMQRSRFNEFKIRNSTGLNQVGVQLKIFCYSGT